MYGVYMREAPASNAPLLPASFTYHGKYSVLMRYRYVRKMPTAANCSWPLQDVTSAVFLWLGGSSSSRL